MTLKVRPVLTRRRLIKTGASAVLLTAASGVARPYLSRAADRPQITHGVQSGDISVDSGVVWSRTDRPSRMLIEIATTEASGASTSFNAFDTATNEKHEMSNARKNSRFAVA